MNVQVIDLASPLYGSRLPLDHGRAVVAARSRAIPAIGHRLDWGVRPALSSGLLPCRPGQTNPPLGSGEHDSGACLGVRERVVMVERNRECCARCSEAAMAGTAESLRDTGGTYPSKGRKKQAITAAEMMEHACVKGGMVGRHEAHTRKKWGHRSEDVDEGRSACGFLWADSMEALEENPLADELNAALVARDDLTTNNANQAHSARAARPPAGCLKVDRRERRRCHPDDVTAAGAAS
jgi:hypothetical protein